MAKHKKKMFRKNPILFRFAVVLVLALAISSLISSVLLSDQMRKQNVEVLEKTIAVVDYSLDYKKPLQEQIQAIHSSALSGDIRVTVIDPDGTVLADTDLENVGRSRKSSGQRRGSGGDTGRTGMFHQIFRKSGKILSVCGKGDRGWRSGDQDVGAVYESFQLYDCDCACSSRGNGGSLCGQCCCGGEVFRIYPLG